MKSGFARAVRKVGPITGPAHARPCKAWNFMAIPCREFRGLRRYHKAQPST